jgi:hypothetical protein
MEKVERLLISLVLLSAAAALFAYTWKVLVG